MTLFWLLSWHSHITQQPLTFLSLSLSLSLSSLLLLEFDLANPRLRIFIELFLLVFQIGFHFTWLGNKFEGCGRLFCLCKCFGFRSSLERLFTRSWLGVMDGSFLFTLFRYILTLTHSLHTTLYFQWHHLIHFYFLFSLFFLGFSWASPSTFLQFSIFFYPFHFLVYLFPPLTLSHFIPLNRIFFFYVFFFCFSPLIHVLVLCGISCVLSYISCPRLFSLTFLRILFFHSNSRLPEIFFFSQYRNQVNYFSVILLLHFCLWT